MPGSMTVPASNNMGKKSLSPFYVDEASLPKKKPVTKKPASGMIAALYEAKKTTREKDDELRAMAARIAALQEAEKNADRKIQQAKSKAEKILLERSVANKVEYVRADDEPSPGGRANTQKAGRSSAIGGSSTGRAGSSSISAGGSRTGKAQAEKGRPPSNSKAATGETRPVHGPKSRSISRSNSEKVDRRVESSLASSSRRLSEGSSRSPKMGHSHHKTSKPRCSSVDPRKKPHHHAAATPSGGIESPVPSSRSPSDHITHSTGRKRMTKESSKIQPYVHPALLDSDSDDDEGPSLADVLTMPGLFGEGPGDGLDGLLARYADDDSQPLQSVMDAAKEGLEWVSREESRLRKLPKAPLPKVCSTAEGGFTQISGCVSEVGAGAWG